MAERGKYADAIQEAVESICSTAARLSNLSGHGHSVRFSDVRLRRGAEEILEKLKKFDDLNEYDKMLDEKEQSMEKEKLEIAKKEADLDMREQDLIKSLSKMTLLESIPADNQPQLESLRTENEDLKRQVAQLKEQVQELEDTLGFREIGPVEVSDRSLRVRHRPSTFTMASGPPAKRRSISNQASTEFELTMPSVEQEADTPRSRIERTPALSLLNIPATQPWAQSQMQSPRSTTKTLHSIDAAWNSVNWSELDGFSREQVKKWFQERAEKVTEKAQADVLRLGAKGADCECHHNRWHRKFPHSKKHFSERRWCPNRGEHVCLWIEAIPDTLEDSEVKYRAHLRS